MSRLLALIVCAALPGIAQNPTVLQLRVVQGEGAVYAAGSRATRGVIVAVTDETGKAVADAEVLFRLPEQGATGQFRSGTRSEAVNTSAEGLAEVWGMQWGREAGAFELRITAAKGGTRGGVLCPLYLSAAPVLTGSAVEAERERGGSKKKLWITLALAAGAGVGVFVVAGSKVPAAISPGTINSVQIGPPAITIGRP